MAWPLDLLEKHCTLWGKGSLLTRLTSHVNGPACPGADELPQGSAAAASSAEGGGVICQLFSDHLRGAQGVLPYAPIGRPGETKEEEYQFLACLLLSGIFTCLPGTRSDHLRSSVQFADPSRLLQQMSVCFWETLIMPQMHILACLEEATSFFV